MSIVFLGTSEFAAGILGRLAASEASRPALVITRPDRPRGRGRALSAPPVAQRALELGLALAQPPSVNGPDARELIARARGATEAQARERPAGHASRVTLVVCAFGALIREPLLGEHEILNVHPSLLPRWRGAAPIERAIMAGDERSGVSIMRLTAGLDSGPVCLQGIEAIAAEDTFGSLGARLQELGAALLLRALEESPPFREQDEQGVTYAEKITAQDRLLDPARGAPELERVIRALSPHIGARVAMPDGSVLGVRAARLAHAPRGDRCPDRSPESEAPRGGERGGAPGVRVEDSRLLLACSPGELELLVVQPPGGRPMDAGDYLRGHWPPART